MKARISLLMEKLRSAYWFIPSLMLLGSGALAFGLIALDERVQTQTLRGFWWIFSGGPQGARSLLSTVAGSVITVAGTTFSITVAVLSLTSSQFGPRLLRGFLRDRANQIVLGTFVSTFLYCLLVLRVVRSVEEVAFVPHIAVTGGVLLAVASVGVLLFFIHHVSTSIQVSQIIASVAYELDEAIARLYPDETGQDVSDEAPESGEERLVGQEIRARRGGYVQTIDTEALLALAKERNAVLGLVHMPGEFVAPDSTLAIWYPAVPVAGHADDSLTARVNAAFTLGKQRTATQDAGFLLLQLVEIATRALSPGVNDPFTALLCLDRLGAALSRLATRRFPDSKRQDDQGTVRLIAPSFDFANYTYLTFTSLRHYGSGDPLVAERLLQVIGEVASHVRGEGHRANLRQHLDWARSAALADAKEAERGVIEKNYASALQRFEKQR